MLSDDELQPLVSIIISVFNDHHTISDCIASAVSQSYENIEVIIIDDHSEIEINIESSLASMCKIYRNPKNMGVAYCRNKGVKMSSGKLICFLDSDDRFLPDKIEKQVLKWNAHQHLKHKVVGTGVYVKDHHTQGVEVRVPVSSQDPKDFFAGIWYYPGSAILLGKTTFEAIGGFDNRLRRLEDYDFSIRLSRIGGTFVAVKEPLAEILRSRRAKYADIKSASHLIIKKYFNKHLPMNHKRLMVAYLALELGAQNFIDNRYFRAVSFLSISWLLAPRVTVSIKRWWLRSRIK